MPKPQRIAGLAILFIFQLWLAHAIGYLIHEYAHSFTAWAFGYKSNPLALDYGHLSVSNVLILGDIDENVDYDPIFAAGRGWIASLIAVAGVLIGNGIGYLISRYGYLRAKQTNKHSLAQFFYLFWLMNVGNFLSYVPNRTFATHADMATVERGLNASPWWIVIVLGIPFSIAIVHFLARILPDARRYLALDNYATQIALTILTTFFIFMFFGSAGISNYGPISHALAVTCIAILFPLATILCWPRKPGAPDWRS